MLALLFSEQMHAALLSQGTLSDLLFSDPMLAVLLSNSLSTLCSKATSSLLSDTTTTSCLEVAHEVEGATLSLAITFAAATLLLEDRGRAGCG
jgi:hypothetical protein